MDGLSSTLVESKIISEYVDHDKSKQSNIYILREKNGEGKEYSVSRVIYVWWHWPEQVRLRSRTSGIPWLLPLLANIDVLPGSKKYKSRCAISAAVDACKCRNPPAGPRVSDRLTLSQLKPANSKSPSRPRGPERVLVCISCPGSVFAGCLQNLMLDNHRRIEHSVMQ